MTFKNRIKALEDRLLKPDLPWSEIMAHLAKQMTATCVSPEAGGGYVPTPPELMQYREYFLYSTREEYEATLSPVGGINAPQP